ncbi:MAG: cell envelope integrity protein TolA, partial [Pseudomonadota bacterium]
TPTPPRPTPRPQPPTPAPPTKAQPTPRPATPAPARPAPQRTESSLDLDALAGPTRPTNNRGRPATGQQGAGTASQATGPQITAIFNQVYPNWILPCDIPGADQLRIQVELTLSADGRITRGPSLINAQSSNVYRAAADGALRALRQTAPFDVPQGFPGGVYRPTFNTERACRNR